MTEKTGYDVDMLDPDLDLEADLGIDTVKQAELIAAIRDAWDIPRDDSIKLQNYPTLAHIVRFVYAKRPDLAAARDAAQAVASAAVNGAPAVAQAAVASAPVAPAPASAADAVQARVFALVTEKTGYDTDMLDPDLDLEADLGIDTVKQAELIAAIRDAWDIPRDDSIKLQDYPTLAHIVRFVYAKRPDLAATRDAAQTPARAVASAAPPPAAPVNAPVPTAPASPAAPSASPSTDPIRARVFALVTEKTGYDADMLDPDLDLEADLGIDTVKQAELIAAIRDEWDIPRDDGLKLQDYPTLAHIVRFVYAKRPDLAAAQAAPPASVQAASAAPPSSTSATASASAPVTSGSTASTSTAAAPSVPSTAAPTPSTDAVRARVFALVTEKTGYDADMLDPDLDLEADLGIDTVKQAELIAAIRTEWDIPRDDGLKLQDYPTLAHIVRFVYAKRPDLAPADSAPPATATHASSSEVPSAPPSAAAPPASPAVSASPDLVTSTPAPRRVPTPVLRPAVCLPTGVRLGAGSRVTIVASKGGPSETVANALRGLLVARGAEIVAPDAEGPIHGVYWLRGLDPVDLRALDLAGWREALRLRVKDLYALMRARYEESPFLVSAVALGGLHGYGPDGAQNPLGGGITGFTKTWARERPTALAKAVDFATGTPADVVAAALLAETETDPGAVEIGRRDGRRWGIGLVETAAGPEVAGVLRPETVIMVTGAAGSIVSAITADLARAAGGGTFYLLDLTPEPAAGDPDLARFAVDREGLRKDLYDRLKAKGERATPAIVDKLLAGMERAQAARTAIDAVTAAGGKVRWFSGDLRDPLAVGAAVEAARAAHGKVDVLLHAAGLEISRWLPDKKPEEFDLVFDVKADGWFNLVGSGLPFGVTLAFSSIAGRFGNGGQADYASANDLLCKLAAASPAGTRGLAIDWTAWGGIGMATRGSIPKVLAAAGIEMLDPGVGLATIRRELTCGTGETVAAGRLGLLMAERDSLDASAIPSRPMLDRVTAFGLYGGLRAEADLTPKDLPFLDHHRIEGTAVLPGVMGVEAFVEAARTFVPGATSWTVEDVQFLAPFKFYRNATRTVTVEALARRDSDGAVVVDCRLLGHRVLHGHTEPEVTEHFRGRVRFGAAPPPTSRKVPKVKRGVDAEAIYQVYFHGPAYQVLDRIGRVGEEAVALLPATLLDDGAAGTLATPRLLEAAFQAAGALQIAEAGTMGLPSVLRSATWTPSGEPGRAVFVRGGPEEFDAQVVDAAGTVVLTVTGYRTATLGPIEASPRAPFASALSG